MGVDEKRREGEREGKKGDIVKDQKTRVLGFPFHQERKRELKLKRERACFGKSNSLLKKFYSEFVSLAKSMTFSNLRSFCPENDRLS